MQTPTPPPAKAIIRNCRTAALRLLATFVCLQFWSVRRSILNLSGSISSALTNNNNSSHLIVPSSVNQTTTTPNTPSLRAISTTSTTNTIAQELVLPPPPDKDEPERPQPYTGARDANGRLGYVADVTRVRRLMLDRYFSSLKQQEQVDGDHNAVVPLLQWALDQYSTNGTDPCRTMRFTEEGTQALLKIVPDHPGVLPYPDHNFSFVPAHTNRSEEFEHYNVFERRGQANNNVTQQSKQQSPRRLLCVVYTYAGKHEQVSALAETWAWKCDGFFAASTETVDDPTQLGYGAINLTHAGPESYDNMWQKTRSILAYVYQHYRHDYDYYWVGGDDTYLVVENVRRWLEIVEDRYDSQTEPLYLGHPIKASYFKFAGGGAGYVLNRKALELYLEKAVDCAANTEIAAEDRYLGKCFSRVGILVQDTADARGQQRFIGYDPDLMGKTSVGLKFWRNLFQLWMDDHPRTTIGPGLISEQAFGLHLLKYPGIVHHTHALLYRTCPADSVVGQFVKANDKNATSTN